MMNTLLKSIALGMVLVLISIVTIAEETTKSPVLVLNDTNQPPYTTKEGDGYVDILVAEAFKKAGLPPPKLVKLPPERGLLSVNNGLIDGDLQRLVGLEKKYPNLIMVPEVIREADFCALSTISGLSSAPEELKKHVVGYIKGWKIYEKMMAGSKKIITASSPDQLIRLLELNRIEVALYNCLDGFTLAKKMGIKGVKLVKPQFKKVKLYLYLNNKHEHLVPKLTKALSDLRKEGFNDMLHQKIILPYIENSNSE